MTTEKITAEELESLFKMCIAAQKEISFVQPANATDAEAIGLLISHHFKWSGLDALRVCYAALEDSNFHGENEIINDLIEKLKART